MSLSAPMSSAAPTAATAATTDNHRMEVFVDDQKQKANLMTLLEGIEVAVRNGERFDEDPVASCLQAFPQALTKPFESCFERSGARSFPSNWGLRLVKYPFSESKPESVSKELSFLLRGLPPAGLSRTLTSLDCSQNNLSEFPDCLAKLRGLKVMKLARNALSALPASLTSLPKLEELDISDNQFSVFPEAIFNLSLLRGLNLGGNQLRELPASWRSWRRISYLTQLHLHKNPLQTLPVALGSLTSVVNLSLQDCPQLIFPEREIVEQTQEAQVVLGYLAQMMDSDGNKIEAAHEFLLAQWRKDTNTMLSLLTDTTKSELLSAPIRHVDLSSCSLNEVPDMVWLLREVEKLLLDDNHISTLSPSISNLEKLQLLSLRGNELQFLPVTIGKLRHLRHIELAGNPPFLNPPQEVIDKGADVICKFQAQVLAEGVNHKAMLLVLIGNGEAGKSSVTRCLCNEKSNTSEYIDVDEGRTIGIDVRTWKPALGDGLQFTIYDVGGQAVYHSIHQFFLTRRSVFLLVWRVNDMRREGQLSSANMKLATSVLDWIDLLQIKVPGASVLLVATHVDSTSPEDCERQCEFVERETHRKVSLVQGMEAESWTAKYMQHQGVKIKVGGINLGNGGKSFKLDCRKGDGVATLREKLVATAKQSPFYDELVPRSYLRLQERLMQINRQGKRTMDWKEYVRACSACNVSAEHQQMAIQFFHDTGTIRYFHAEAQAINRDRLAGSKWAVSVRPHKADEQVSVAIGQLTLMSGGLYTDFQVPGTFPIARDTLRWTLKGNKIVLPEVGFLIDLSPGDGVYWRVIKDWELTLNEDHSAFDAVYDNKNVNQEWKVSGERITESRPADGEGENQPLPEAMLSRSIFVDVTWILDVLKGLIRHSRDLLLKHFKENRDTVMSRHVRRLMVHGILHESLLPFLWPCVPEQSARNFWKTVRESSSEAQLWGHNVVDSQKDFGRLIALLSAFDIIMKKDAAEFTVPAVLDSSCVKALSPQSFSVDECPFFSRITYSSIPPGFFSRIIVRAGANRSHVDFNASTCMVYSMGFKALLFMTRSDDGLAHTLTLHCSGLWQWAQLMEQIWQVGQTAAGLIIKSAEYRNKAGDLVTIPHSGFDAELRTLLPKEFPQCLVIGSYDAAREHAAVTISSDQTWHFYDEPEAALLSSSPLPGVLEGMQVAFTWNDQGFGNQKGLFILKRMRNGKEMHSWGRLEIPVAPHSQESVSVSVQLHSASHSERAFLNAAVGDTIEVWYQVGGGGGHALTLGQIRIVLWPARGAFRNPLTHETVYYMEGRLSARLISMRIWRRGDTLAKIKAKVCLLCVDDQVGNDADVQRVVQECHDNNTILIPVLCAGFKNTIRDFNHWWPARLSVLQHHKLFVDLNTVDDALLDVFASTVQKQLLDWRGNAASPAVAAQAGAQPTGTGPSEEGGAVIPCPRCVNRGEVPPFGFDRDRCVLAYETDKSAITAVTCGKCRAPVPILEVLVPEVFLSYNWDNQPLVKELRRVIELELEMVCWMDIAGGLESGSDHIQRMKAGILGARVAILFLTDKYLKSVNCRYELQNAFETALPLIPVLAPGWSAPEEGATAAGWWEHARKVWRDAGLDPVLDEREVMDTLTPIDMRQAHDEDEDELLRRIAQRLHRRTYESRVRKPVQRQRGLVLDLGSSAARGQGAGSFTQRQAPGNWPAPQQTGMPGGAFPGFAVGSAPSIVFNTHAVQPWGSVGGNGPASLPFHTQYPPPMWGGMLPPSFPQPLSSSLPQPSGFMPGLAGSVQAGAPFVFGPGQ